jgi:hypothetical protein
VFSQRLRVSKTEMPPVSSDSSGDCQRIVTLFAPANKTLTNQLSRKDTSTVDAEGMCCFRSGFLFNKNLICQVFYVCRIAAGTLPSMFLMAAWAR